jgi:hypothetical protein
MNVKIMVVRVDLGGHAPAPLGLPSVARGLVDRRGLREKARVRDAG